MAYATRATLKERQRKAIDVEVDGDVYCLRRISGAEKDLLEASVFQGTDDGGRRQVSRGLRAMLVALSWIDPVTRERMYGDDEVEELNAEMDGATLEALFWAAHHLNGMPKNAVEAAAKNSESAATGASDSA